MDFTNTFKITPTVRKALAKPIGELFAGAITENLLKLKERVKNQPKKPQFVCVGDVVSQGFLNDDYLSSYLKMCIIDEKTKRGQFQMSANLVEYYITRIHNPPGILRSSAIHEIQTQLQSSHKSLVIVDGEEDLLVIPVILHSPDNTYVVYGQPPLTDLKNEIPAGLVLISVNAKIKTQVQNLLDQFEKL